MTAGPVPRTEPVGRGGPDRQGGPAGRGGPAGQDGGSATGRPSAGPDARVHHNRAYCDGRLTSENIAVEQLVRDLADPDLVVWSDLLDPTAEQLDRVRQALHLHPLATEDAFEPHQRPKLDRYGHHRFLAVYAMTTSESGQPQPWEINAFITERALVTVRTGSGFDLDTLTKRWDSLPDLAVNGVAFLLHGLLDTVVDSQIDTLLALDDRLEDVENQLFADATDRDVLQRQIFEIRRDVGTVRRLVSPMREVLDRLVGREGGLVDSSMRPFFGDVTDHAIRATEMTESQREEVLSLIDANLNLTSNRLNVIMKSLAGWAAVIAVPTAVTGFFGQNVPFPGFGHSLGFVVSLVLIIGLSVGIYVLLRKRDWI